MKSMLLQDRPYKNIPPVETADEAAGAPRVFSWRVFTLALLDVAVFGLGFCATFLPDHISVRAKLRNHGWLSLDLGHWALEAEGNCQGFVSRGGSPDPEVIELCEEILANTADRWLRYLEVYLCSPRMIHAQVFPEAADQDCVTARTILMATQAFRVMCVLTLVVAVISLVMLCVLWCCHRTAYMRRLTKGAHRLMGVLMIGGIFIHTLEASAHVKFNLLPEDYIEPPGPPAVFFGLAFWLSVAAVVCSVSVSISVSCLLPGYFCRDIREDRPYARMKRQAHRMFLQNEERHEAALHPGRHALEIPPAVERAGTNRSFVELEKNERSGSYIPLGFGRD